MAVFTIHPKTTRAMKLRRLLIGQSPKIILNVCIIIYIAISLFQKNLFIRLPAHLNKRKNHNWERDIRE